MTKYVNDVINPAAPWSFIPDTEENILKDLSTYILDPVFEWYGNFVNRSPEWLDEKKSAEYAGCAVIFGNFQNYSHAFNVITDDEALISRISAAVQRNKSRPEYQEARKKMIAELPVLMMKNAHVGYHYSFCGGWLRLTRVWRISEDDANRDSLLYLDRWEGIDCDGHTHGGAFSDGHKISTTKNWSINADSTGQSLFPLA